MMRTILATLLILTLIHPAIAQELLTGSQIEHFLNTLEQLNELPDLNTEPPAPPTDMSAADLEAKMKAPFTSSLDQIRDHEMFPKGLSIMKSEGFDDEKEWAAVGDRVMHAYAALQMQGARPSDMDSKMAQAMKELEASDLPEEMKQRMRDAMTVSKGMVETMDDVPQANIDALRPYVDRLENLSGAPKLEN